MKRYIRASWNGIVPVSQITKHSDLTRKAAQTLKEWIYHQGLDVGYSYLEDFLDNVDLDAEYARMLKFQKENPERWEKLMGVKNSTKITSSSEPWNDPEVEYVCNTNGYQCYRKIVNGRGRWFAHRQDDPIESMVPITYDQARGFEPMPGETEIEKLQRKLGEMLLPKY